MLRAAPINWMAITGLTAGKYSWAVSERRYSGRQMGRKPKDDDATQNLRPEDKTQRAKAGTKIGLLSKDEVMAAFRKIVKPR
jgi:hypothetical protein